MSFVEFLKEALTRDRVADLASYVAVVSVDREEEGNPRKYLNLIYAKNNGEVEWVEINNPGIFIMKGKFLKDIYPKIKGKIGKVKFVDREKVRNEMGYGSVGAIQTDVERRVAAPEKEESD